MPLIKELRQRVADLAASVLPGVEILSEQIEIVSFISKGGKFLNSTGRAAFGYVEHVEGPELEAEQRGRYVTSHQVTLHLFLQSRNELDHAASLSELEDKVEAVRGAFRGETDVFGDVESMQESPRTLSMLGGVRMMVLDSPHGKFFWHAALGATVESVRHQVF